MYSISFLKVVSPDVENFSFSSKLGSYRIVDSFDNLLLSVIVLTGGNGTVDDRCIGEPSFDLLE